MERTPPSGFSSDPDLSRHNLNPNNTRKRKQHDIDTCNCEFSMAKFQQNMMDNITQAIKSSVESAMSEKFDKFSIDLDNFKTEMLKISTDNITIKVSVAEMKERLNETEIATNFSNNRQDEFEARLASIEQRSKLVDTYESEIADLKLKHTNIRLEWRKRQQWDRMFNLEVIGVPETNNEDLVGIITQIAKHVNVAVIPGDIEFASRIQPKQPKPGVPRTIIVKMKNRALKDNILAGIRLFRGITRSNIGFEGNQRVYLNEHLTLENKTLYNKCRELATQNSYKYVWIRNCAIFVRRDDRSPKIAINKEEDLQKIK